MARSFWERNPRDKNTAAVTRRERGFQGMILVSPKLSGFLLEEGLEFSVLRVQNWENIWTQNSAQWKETFSNNQAQFHQQGV